jgi:hypothetical protein
VSEAPATRAKNPPRWMNVLHGLIAYPVAIVMLAYVLWQPIALGLGRGAEACAVAGAGIVVSLVAAVVIHEMGHLVAALAVRFRVRQINMLGVHLDLDARKLRWEFNLVKADVAGYVWATAREPVSLPNRMGAFLAGGPLATLLTVVLALSLAWRWQPPLGWAVHPTLRAAWWQAWAWPGSAWVGVCNQLAAVSLYLLVEGVVPFTGKGGRNDALMLLDCARRRPGMFRSMAFLALLEAMKQGVRPRDWDPRWTAELDGEADGSGMQGLADVVAYFHAEDCGRHEDAGRLLDRAREARGEMVYEWRRSIYVETAYYESYHRGDAEQGRHWLQRASREGVEEHTWLRAEAALLGAEGKVGEALALIERALEAVPRSKDPGGSIAERDWLERMRNHYLQRLGQASDVQGDGEGAGTAGDPVTTNDLSGASATRRDES